MDWCLYKYRHLVENAFLRIKRYRGIATRYDKLARNYASNVALAFVIMWLPMHFWAKYVQRSTRSSTYLKLIMTIWLIGVRRQLGWPVDDNYLGRLGVTIGTLFSVRSSRCLDNISPTDKRSCICSIANKAWLKKSLNTIWRLRLAKGTLLVTSPEWLKV